MEFKDVLLKRRSIRRFKQEPVKKRTLEKLIDAARLAPSAGNIQPLKYLVIIEREKYDIIFQTIKWAKFVQPKRDPKENERPTAYILVLVDKEISNVFSDYLKYDIGAAVQSILLRAYDLGLGSCWIGAFNRKFITEGLNIPNRFFLDSLIALGYPDEKPVLEDVKNDSKYYLDEKDTIHVPKRKINDILFWETI